MTEKKRPKTEKPWSRPWEDVAGDLGVSVHEGLEPEVAAERRRRFGPNRLKSRKRKPARVILWDQVRNPVMALLLGASILSFSFGRFLESLSIAVAIVINGAIGFFTELKATRSMEALQRLGRVEARVLRGGEAREIPSEKIVPGDIVLLDAGDVVPADIRLQEVSRLQTDESSLTGESVAVNKEPAPLDASTALAERRNMVFRGTAVTMGSGRGIVTATGMETELGRVASLAAAAESDLTPLEKRLGHLAHRLIWVTLGIALLMVVIGLFTGREFLLIVETSVALAVAAIPEGLPIVATLALARGMWMMARRNALMNRLSAVETLGSTNVICTDKTGTLTENRMTLSRILLPSVQAGESDGVEIASGDGEEDGALFRLNGEPVDPSGHPLLQEVLQTGVLCNGAELGSSESREDGEAVGDPMEIALLRSGAQAGMTREALLRDLPMEREESFDPQVMMMATYHRSDSRYLVAVKGAPEAVLEACTGIRTEEGERDLDDGERKDWLDRNDGMAEAGLRVLAVAARAAESTGEDPYRGLVFLGLLGLLDPPRRDVAEAIRICREAGIRIVMVTGDQPVTARHIARDLELTDEENPGVVMGKDLKDPDTLSEEERDRLLKVSIFARVTPKQKLDLVKLFQKNGQVVAMTGDGVNDAPALQKADIGVAMGRRGTQVAREAADVVLRDDAFRTIVVAIQQGRAIFDNIRKFMLFLFSGNAGEIMIVAFALVAGMPLPLLPLQILYLNMIGDVFPALALGVGRGDASKMKRPPRDPREPVLTGAHWIAVGGYGIVIAASVLAAFWIALSLRGMEMDRAVSVSFLTLAFARLWHVFNMREAGSHVLGNEVSRNLFVWGALVLCSFLLLAALYLPGISTALRLVPPGLDGWCLLGGMSLVPLVMGQVVKELRTRVAAGKEA